MPPPVVIVGGGVMGFAAAVRLLEAGFDDVTMVATRFASIPSKTSPAVFRPDWLGQTDPLRVIRWGEDTKAHLRDVYRSNGSEAGISSITHLEIYRGTAARDTYEVTGGTGRGMVLRKVMEGFREMTQEELLTHFPQADGGFHYSSYMIEGSRYVPYLEARALALGLRVITGTVEGTPDSAEFCVSAVEIAAKPACRIVVNTTGVSGGSECYPVRGQLVLVKAPYVKMAMAEYSPANEAYPTYIYPRRDHVVLGSTYLAGDGDSQVRDETTADIIERCSEFIPELKSAPVISEVVCLRPGRTAGVRLDEKVVYVGKERFSMVHNYGHGGAGMSIAWGCSGEVVKIVQEAALRLNDSRL